MARKKETKWYDQSRFTKVVRIDPKYEDDIKKEKGKSFSQKLDNSLAKIYGSRKKGK